MNKPEAKTFLSRLNQTRKGIFYGWWVLVCGAIIDAVGMGIIGQSFTIFFLPLKRDLMASSAAIALLYAALRLEGGLEGPLMGYLVDRFGSRVMIISGAIITVIGLLVISRVHSFWTFFLVYTFLVSTGFNAGFQLPVAAAVNNWFIRRRSLGFAVLNASINVGAMVMAPIVSFIILSRDWRTAYIFVAIVITIITIPAALPMHRSPESRGLYPDGIPPKSKADNEAAPANHVTTINYTPKQALKTVGFWVLVSSLTLRILVTQALNTHFVPILVWKGVSEATAAYFVSLLAFLSIVTVLIAGWVGDRLNKAILCSILVLPCMVGMVGLLLGQGMIAIYVYVIGMAFTAATAPLGWSLIGDLFGRQSYATLRGTITVVTGTATFLSPIYAGWVFDRTNSYNEVLILFTAIFVLASFFFALLRKYLPAKA